MNNADLPEKPPKMSLPPDDDIPVAMRDTPTEAPTSKWKSLVLIGSLVGIGAIALLSIVLLFLSSKSSVTSSEVPSNPETSTANTPTTASTASSSQTANDNILLGHFAYKEAPQSELEPITSDGRIRMRKAAARKFKAMVAAARASGVSIVPISGFRTVSEQQHLFFDVKAQRGQVAAKRAEVSAPPGYSEHHTGYAADIGDGNVPATNLSPKFENTAAFKWLKANAPYYSFELSFPRNNSQGVIYEPWHWRYVGDQQSLETFYKAKNLQKSGANK